jgi:uncharacterized repeat protein (TIGR02543 family)
MRKILKTKKCGRLKNATLLFLLISNLLIAALCAACANAQTLGGTVFSGDANCGYLKVATPAGLYGTASETIDIIFTIGTNANLANSYGLVGGAASEAINIFLDGNPNGNSRINFNMASGDSEFYLKGGGLLSKGVTYHLVAEMDNNYRRMWIGTGTSLAPMELNTTASGNEYGLFSNSTSKPISVIGAFYGTSGAFDGTIASVRINNNSKEYIGGAALNSSIGNITVSNTLTSVAGSTQFLMTPATVIPTYAYITAGSYSGTSQTFTAKNDFSAGQTIFLNGVTSPTQTVLSATSTQFVVTYGSNPNLTGANYALSSAVTNDNTGGHSITWPSSLCSTSASAPTQLANYQLSVTQGSNGTISPSSTQAVSGSSQTFTFTPSAGYSVASITIDGTALGSAALSAAITSGYTFSSITASHTVTAAYLINTYGITITQTSNGTVAPSTASYDYGSSQTFTFTPGTGYSVASITIDGTALGSAALSAAITSGYTFSTIAATHTATATYSRITYPITFDSNGGTGSQVATTYAYSASPALVLPSTTTFSKVGYSFLGWADTSTSTTLITTYAKNSPAVFWAVWAPKVYTVSYQSNGGTGSIPSSNTYSYGSAALTLPLQGSLVRAGFSFAGWSETPTGSAIGLTYTPSATIALQAIWQPISYTVTYALAGGTSSQPTEASHNIYQHFVIANSPTKSGSVFGGWSDGVSLFSAGSSYTVSNANITLTAIWIPLYTLHYVLNGSLDTPVGDRLITSGTLVQLAPAPTRFGYDFLNWTDQTSTTHPASGNFTIVSDSTISAVWNPKQFSVTYVLAGASGTIPIHADVTIDEIVVLPASPTRAGYTFDGWSDGTSIYAPGGQYVNRGANLSFSAVWSQNSALAISYNAGSGTGAVPLQGSLLETESFTVSAASALSYTGFTFSGWEYNSIIYQPGSVITVGSSPIVLTAQWLASYSVTYLPGGASGSVPSTTLDHLANSTFLVESASGLNYPGYNFAGWVNGVNIFQAGSSYTVISSDVEFVASWILIPVGNSPSASTARTPYPTQSPTPTPPTMTSNIQPTSDMKLIGTVYMASGSYTLSNSSKMTLKVLANQIKSLDQNTILVYGHTDNRLGVNNIWLSQQRAKAVASYLQPVTQGKKIIISWYASRVPISSGNSPADLAKNRRVEIYTK